MRHDIYIRLLARNLAYSEIRRTTQALQQMSATANLVGAAMHGIMIAGAISGIGELGRVALDFAKTGASFESVKLAYKSMSDEIGVDSVELLQNLRNITNESISDMDLMLTANKALLTKDKEIVEAVPRLLEIARAVALTTGKDISQIYDDIMRGILKASPRIIDNAEIYINVTKVVDDYAKKMGIAASAIDDVTKRHLILNGVLEQGSAYIRNTGLDAEQAAEQVNTLGAAWANLKAAIGRTEGAKWFTGALADVAEAITPNTDLIDMYGDKMHEALMTLYMYDTAMAEKYAAMARKIQYEGGDEAIEKMGELYDEIVALNEGFANSITPMSNWGDAASKVGEKARQLADMFQKVASVSHPVNPSIHVYGIDDARNQLDRFLISLSNVYSTMDILRIRAGTMRQIGMIFSTPASDFERMVEVNRLLSEIRAKANIKINVKVYGLEDG